MSWRAYYDSATGVLFSEGSGGWPATTPPGREGGHTADRGAGHGGEHDLHVTLPGLRAGNIGAQVFASWTWSHAHKGQEYEVAMSTGDDETNNREPNIRNR